MWWLAEVNNWGHNNLASERNPGGSLISVIHLSNLQSLSRGRGVFTANAFSLNDQNQIPFLYLLLKRTIFFCFVGFGKIFARGERLLQGGWNWSNVFTKVPWLSLWNVQLFVWGCIRKDSGSMSLCTRVSQICIVHIIFEIQCKNTVSYCETVSRILVLNVHLKATFIR